MRYASLLLAAGLTLAACDTRLPTGHLSGVAGGAVTQPTTPAGTDSVTFVVVHPGGMCIKSDVKFDTQFHASGADSMGRTKVDTLRPVSWSSSDPGIATINAQGLFRPVPGVGGQVTIMATYKALSGKMTATVDPLPTSIPLKCAALGI